MIRIACAGAIGKFAESVSANAGGRLGWIMAVSALQSEVRRPQENLKMGGASRRNVRMPGAWEDEGVDARNKAFQIGFQIGVYASVKHTQAHCGLSLLWDGASWRI